MTETSWSKFQSVSPTRSALKVVVYFHFKTRFQFYPSDLCEAHSLDCSLWMNRPPCAELVLPPTSWFLQLGHPMPNSNPTHRPSVTGRAQKRKSPMMKLAILKPLGLHSNENCQEVNTTNLYIIWHFTSFIATQIKRSLILLAPTSLHS